MSRIVFTVAVAAIALHVIDDSFLQPAAGTAAGDHLVSGIVPVLALALLAWTYGNVRAGFGAAIALLLAPLGVIAGAEAIQAMTSGARVSGDDWSGLLATTAGLVLLGSGALTLWRTRRRDGSRWRRHARRASLGVLAFVCLAWIDLPIIVAYGVTHVAGARAEKELRVAHENITLTTSDGLRLAGLYVPSRNGAAIIAFPGRNGPQAHARMLARHGYGVLLLDRRGQGRSEGDPNAFGWKFDKDIRAAIDFLKRRPDVEPGRIGGLGLSVGGEMMLQTAAETDDLAAVVSEGAGSRVFSEELSDAKGVGGLFGLPLAAIKTAAVAIFDNASPPRDLTALLPRIAPRPVLLINAQHGEVDDKATEYFEAARQPKAQWLVPRGGHIQGIRAMPEEYERRVVGFFDRALPGGLPSGRSSAGPGADREARGSE